MRVCEIYEILDQISPFDLQAKWDNSGLNVGNFHASCNKVYVALELDSVVLEQLEQKSLLIVHHPLIFKPLQNIHTNLYPSHFIAECLRKEVSVISMHTNFDVTHLNDAFAKRLALEALGFSYKHTKDFSLIYTHNGARVTPQALAMHIKHVLGLPLIRYTKASDSLNDLYITCGSNASAYMIAGARDCIITGDIKYHDAMIASSNEVSFMEVPHFESECNFAHLVAKTLQKHNIQAIILNSQNPFCYA